MLYTDHSKKRAAQRGLQDWEIEYVKSHGILLRRKGANIYFLRKKDISEEDISNDDYRCLAGTALIMSPCSDTLITVWRNSKKGLKIIQRKPRYFFQEETDAETWID